MPYQLRKVKGKDCYSVKSKKIANTKTKRRVYSKCTTKEKAKRQIRLLNALENNKNFTLKKK